MVRTLPLSRPRSTACQALPRAAEGSRRLQALVVRGAALFATLALAAAAHAQTGDARRGETLFAECSACHSMQDGTHGVGPSLAGIGGRRAASHEGFRYSPALRRANLSWTAQTLDAFIADPQKVVPGNRMPYSGLAQERDRAELVAWILRGGR